MSDLELDTITACVEAATKGAQAALLRAAFEVNGKHHFWASEDGVPTCLCGFTGSARKRTQTEHITQALVDVFLSKLEQNALADAVRQLAELKTQAENVSGGTND